MEIIICGIAGLLIAALVIRTASSPNKVHNHPAKKDNDSKSSDLTPVNHTSTEERKQMQQVAAYCGEDDIPRISQSDVQRNIIHNISSDFQRMPGWNVWDRSIHEAPGQLDRLERSFSEKISIISYDPKYRIAKIQGESSVYLASHARCSCLDYKKRKLPCKHMYALAVFLNGNVEQEVYDETHPALYGLSFALAGRFPGGRNSPEGIRSKINSRGGLWSDDLTDESCALICCEAASAAKLADAKSLDLQIFSPLEAMDIFAVENRLQQ